MLESARTTATMGNLGIDDIELAALRDKHSRMRSLLQQQQQQQQSVQAAHRPVAAVAAPSSRRNKPLRQAVRAVAGYTMLIFDTNVVLFPAGPVQEAVEEDSGASSSPYR